MLFRSIELFSILLILLSILLLLSFLTYSPDDPNFIFPKNVEIKNLLGFTGSYISDLFFQSIGIISFLIPITIFFTSINLFKNKKLVILIENIFFSVLYSVFGCLFLSVFYDNSFWLIFNGNGGFVGNFLEKSFLFSIINLNSQISYYLLIILVLFLFLVSINFNLKVIINSFKKYFFLIKKNKLSQENIPIDNSDSYSNSDENVNTRIQVDLPFSQNINIKKNETKFKLPLIDFLKEPSKKEKENRKNDKNDETILEKILLDFGVEGKIKKIRDRKSVV